MDNEVVKIQNNSMALSIYDRALELAIEKGSPLEQLEKFMELKERWEKGEARKAYVKAMADFKANPPEILKTVHVSYVNNKNQTVEWDHADLGEITQAISSSMSSHGLYSRWDQRLDDKNVTVTCIITHEMGHSEQITMSGPPDTSGGKDSLKAVASTNTVLQRLTLLALTGLAAKGCDRESTPDPVATITEEQAVKINDLISKLYGENKDMIDKCIAYMKIESVKKMPASEFNKHLNGLSGMLKQRESAKKERIPGQEG